MRKTPYQDEAARLAKAKRRLRSQQIRDGVLPGLVEKGTRTIRPDIRALIDAALEERARRAKERQAP
ncbi:hypothetical protein [Methylocystis sp. S23]|jgi:hypothetical protein